MAAHKVIKQQNREHSGQRLWQEDAKRCETEDFSAGSLQPETEWWLVNAHKPTRIKRNKEEVMPAVQHAPDGRCVVEIAKAVLTKLVKVHKDRDEHDNGQRESSPDRWPIIFALCP